MSTIIRPQIDPTHPDYHPAIDPALNELQGRITERPRLGDAPDSLADVVLELVMVLHDDQRDDKDSPAATAEVIGFVDEALGVLRSIRSRAIEENRRRMDAAMSRSAKLLGIDEEGTR